MIGRHLDSFAGLNGKESKTDLNSDLWEEVPSYVFDREARGDPGIVWDAQEYPSAHATIIHESDIERDNQEPPRGSDDKSDGQEYVEVALIADGREWRNRWPAYNPSSEDLNADNDEVMTIIDLVILDDGSISSNTYCIDKYFVNGPDNGNGNGPDNGNSNGNGSSGLEDPDPNDNNDNGKEIGSIQTQPDDVINNVMGNISSQSSKSRDDELVDDDATGALGSSMPSLMPPRIGLVQQECRQLLCGRQREWKGSSCLKS